MAEDIPQAMWSGDIFGYGNSIAMLGTKMREQSNTIRVHPIQICWTQIVVQSVVIGFDRSKSDYEGLLVFLSLF